MPILLKLNLQKIIFRTFKKKSPTSQNDFYTTMSSIKSETFNPLLLITLTIYDQIKNMNFLGISNKSECENKLDRNNTDTLVHKLVNYQNALVNREFVAEVVIVCMCGRLLKLVVTALTSILFCTCVDKDRKSWNGSERLF